MVSLSGLFRRRGSPPDDGIYVRARCDACGEVVQTRINRGTDLSLADDGQSYFVRKVLVGRQCFRPIELQIRYADPRGATELARDISGGSTVE